MGLFGKQLLKVIEWTDDSKDVIVYRYPLKDRDEIMNSSTLVVRPSQIALFLHKGQIADVFAPGTYKLATENVPVITKLLSLPTGFDSPIKADVFFVNTKQMTGLKWGTQNPIMMRDNDFGTVRIRAFGAYSYRVEDATKFMKEMFGTNAVYKTEDVGEQIKPMIVQGFTDAVAESKISALDLATNYREFSKTVLDATNEEIAQFGLKLCTMIVENISLPKEVEEALDKRTQLGIMGDKMGTYMQYQAGQAMVDAANNPSGGNLAGMGVGLGAGVGIGQAFSGAMANAQDTPKAAPAASGSKCPKCGANVPAGSKFCPECGEKIPAAKFCPNCGHKLDGSSKFCPECGAKVA